MGRILFLGIAAFLALRYISNSNKKQQKLLEKEKKSAALPEAADPKAAELS